MKHSIAKVVLGIAIFFGALLGMTTTASASDGVLYGKAAQVHKVKKVVKRVVARHYKIEKSRRCTYYGHGAYRCKHFERRGNGHKIARHRHRHVFVRKHGRAKHVADVAVVKAAFVRRPGGRWKLIRARVRGARVYARKRY